MELHTWNADELLNSVAIFGIPVNGLNMAETVEAAFRFVGSYKIDRIPRYIATVNVDFLTNTLGWVYPRLRHPELYHILFHADLATPDGMPLVWLSKLLGSPLKERVTGADMAIELSEGAENTRSSLFFFGGEKETVSLAVRELKKRFPKLNINGTLSPMVLTKGDHLDKTIFSDEEIIKIINDSKADILFIGLGNPKQEVWFQRIKPHIHIALSIGLGGTYAFITGTVKRSPKWMQSAGLEWLYRLFQEPKRLWKRYAKGFLKLACLSAQILIREYMAKIKTISVNERKHIVSSFHAIQTDQNRAISYHHLKLPPYTDKHAMREVVQHLNSTDPKYTVMLDFENVWHITPQAEAAICQIWKSSQHGCQSLYFCSLSPRLMNCSPIWTVLKRDLLPNLLTFIHTISKFQPREKYVTDYLLHDDIHLFAIRGEFDSEALYSTELPEEHLRLTGKWIVDLTDCHRIDNSVIAFLLNWSNHLKSNEGNMIICGAGEHIQKLLKLAEVETCFHQIQQVSKAIDYYTLKEKSP